ncbi:MAG: ATP-binding cassette domain-containing protein [Cellvibrionaceae bacterium]|nr:ATP-binding cassette domain-containing protein [Cellvibrionaceae bacterium]
MLIECKKLSVQFGQRTILRNIDLSIAPQEIVTLLGPNGAGKTTLFKTLIGALQPSAGTLKKKPGLTIGYVPQTLHIDETLPITVKRFMNLPGGHLATTIAESLHHAGVPGLGRQQLRDLSGGQFQRVLLARALLGKPHLLLLDEATQGLDHRGSANFYRQIAHLRETLGCAIVMISHELHVVMRQTDRVICLNGHICCQGKPEVVSHSPEYQALFGLEKDSEAALYRHQGHHLHAHNE